MDSGARAAAVVLCSALLLSGCAGRNDEVDEASIPAAVSEQRAGTTIADLAQATAGLMIFVTAVEAAGLTEMLQNEGPLTVFAPTDAAFEALPGDLLEKLLLPENARLLARILSYHVVPQKLLAADIGTGRLTTVEGFDIRTDISGGITVNGAGILRADLQAFNGVMHIIGEIILPPDLDANLR